METDSLVTHTATHHEDPTVVIHHPRKGAEPSLTNNESQDKKFGEKFSFGRMFGAAVGGIINLPPTRYTVAKSCPETVNIPTREGHTLSTFMVKPNIPDGSAEWGNVPTILVRTPYNKKNLLILGERFAERGFRCLLQDTRGACESTGHQDPIVHEDVDGEDTMLWIKSQPWYALCPRIGMWGPSYLGIVQFAAFPHLDCAVPIACATDLHSVMRPNGGILLGLLTRWHYLTENITTKTGVTGMAKLLHIDMPKKIKQVHEKDFLVEKMDEAVIGKKTLFGDHVRTHVDSGGEHDFWLNRSYSHHLDTTATKTSRPPSCMVGGWYDFFLPEMLKDYGRFVASNDTLEDVATKPEVYLTIGPWQHFDIGLIKEGLVQGMWWLKHYLQKDPKDPESQCGCNGSPHCPSKFSRVRLFVMSLHNPHNKWMNFNVFPVPPKDVWKMFLDKNGGMGNSIPKGTDGDDLTFTFDPHNPTPSFGGADFNPNPKIVGRVNNEKLIARRDVASFRYSVDRQATIIGEITTCITVKTSTPYFDLYVRIAISKAPGPLSQACSKIGLTPDVLNMCDGYIRVTPDTIQTMEREDDGYVTVPVKCTHTAFHVCPGDVLYVIIAGGAHPLFMRNFGTEGGVMEHPSKGVPCRYSIKVDGGVTKVEFPLV